MISRRDFVAGAAAAGIAAAQTRRRPNIVLFLADDLGCHDVGCWGADDLRTPHIDSIAATGARFTNWYSAAPVCAPARAALLTGRYPIRAGVPDNGQPLRAGEVTIASALKPAGYSTALIGKWHLGSTTETDPNAHGFDRFYGFHSGCIDFFSHRYYWGEPRTVNYHDLWRDRTEIFEDGQYTTELFAREGVRFVREHRADPFFLYLPFNAPHYPMHAPERYKERFPKLAPERRTYAAMIAAMDDAIGQVLGAIRDAHLENDTLVLFSADNGATREARAGLDQKPATAGNNAPFRGNKFSAFDGGMHVPMLMSWPGVIPKGRVIREIGNHVDLLPTFVKAAGAPLPSGRTLDGFDALPLAVTGAKSPHDAIFWSSSGQQAVRRGPWKLVRNGKTFDGSPDGNKPLAGDDAIFLSNVDQDPGEARNLRHENTAIADELLTLLDQWIKTVREN